VHYGVSGFDTTLFFFTDPYQYTIGFSREGYSATQRYSGATVSAQYPIDKFRRVSLSTGVIRVREQYSDPSVQQFLEEQAALQGVPFYLNNGTYFPLSVNLTQETTRFEEFGPLSGSTFSIGGTLSLGGSLSRQTVEGDLRKYFRVGSTSMVLATRVRGFKSMGENPEIFYFGGNMEMRGYPYYSFAGNEGFFANVELRLPLVHLAATPIGLLGPIRGTVFLDVGGARYKGQRFTLWTSDPGLSYVNDPVFGEPVTGFHLVDGRASYGLGLQAFVFGYPLHFDWAKLTDLQVVSDHTEFSFWVGFDF
jgi:outer membrane protein assembly factor BamA